MGTTGNFTGNNLSGVNSKLSNTCYWDMRLSNEMSNFGDVILYRNTISSDDLITWIDLNDDTSSNFLTGQCINSLVSSECARSSAFTICDIGLTGIDNGLVQNLTGETLTFNTGDTNLKLCKVSGQTYTYDVTKTIDVCAGTYAELCGGFYQGFFALEGYPYDTLPSRFENGWTVETWLKIGNSGCTTTNTLNSTHSDTDGFFFYIGTRAENKFCNVFSGETGLTTCSGVTLSPGCYDVPTDVNPFLKYRQNFDCNPTTGGSTTQICPPCETLDDGINPFLKYRQNFNCNPITGSTGTTETQPCPTCESPDISDNALGLRIKSDGTIGWRKITTSGTCSGATYIEEVIMRENYSTKSILGPNDLYKWLHITVTYQPYVPLKNICDKKRNGTLSFYVNGMRVYVEENFLELDLRKLTEHKDKQQGVPFNISWGGGTQGLAESQTFNGPDPSDDNLLIEQNFAGTFTGGLSQLRMYSRAIDPTEIRSNFNIEKARYKRNENFGGSQIFIINPSCGA